MRTWFMVFGLLAASCDGRGRAAPLREATGGAREQAARQPAAQREKGTKMGDAKSEELAKLVDAARAQRVPLVLRVIALGPGQGDKYAWVRAKVVAVLKNTTGCEPGAELEIAYYSGKPGLPAEECTVYLEPYNDTPNHPWKLLGGSGVLGVSNPGKSATP